MKIIISFHGKNSPTRLYITHIMVRKDVLETHKTLKRRTIE